MTRASSEHDAGPVTPPAHIEDASHVVWPPERFYWAVLDTAAIGPAAPFAPGRRHERLGYLFEAVLPVPIDLVHAVYRPAPSGGGRVIACGVDRDLLSREAERLGPAAVTLAPERMPEMLGEDDDPRRFNVLTGAFLPRAVRGLRRRWAIVASGVVILCAAAITIGLERRTAAVARLESQAKQSLRAVYAEVLPAGDGGASSALPPERRLVAELRVLERTRDRAAPTAAVDASRSLASLLERWPSGFPAEVDSVSATPSSLTVLARVPATVTATDLPDALEATAGWRLLQPQMRRVRDQVELTMRFVPAARGEITEP